MRESAENKTFLQTFCALDFRPRKSPEPGEVCHICEGPLLEQLSVTSGLQPNLPHQNQLISPPPSTYRSQINKSPCALGRTAASLERTNVAGKWSTSQAG